MGRCDRDVIVWVGSEILPHEASVRAWLRRLVPPAQVDDIIQEAYCRLASLDSVGHIRDGRQYFFQTARNIVRESIRRAKVVRIDTLTETELANTPDLEPSPERIVAGRRELQRIQRIVATLPGRCRRIFELRRIEGVSQKEIAAKLGVTEKTVEAQAARGLRLILNALELECVVPGASSDVARHDEDSASARR